MTQHLNHEMQMDLPMKDFKAGDLALYRRWSRTPAYWGIILEDDRAIDKSKVFINGKILWLFHQDLYLPASMKNED
jgi:predicted small integral membrane protein